MVCFCAAVCGFCGAHIHIGEDRDRWSKFQSRNGDKNSCRARDGMGNGLSDEYAEGHFGDRYEKLGISDTVRACNRGVVAMLLQGTPDWRGVKGRAGR